MKRIISIISTILIATAALFTGCDLLDDGSGSGYNPPSKPVKEKIYIEFDDTVFSFAGFFNETVTSGDCIEEGESLTFESKIIRDGSIFNPLYRVSKWTVNGIDKPVEDPEKLDYFLSYNAISKSDCILKDGKYTITVSCEIRDIYRPIVSFNPELVKCTTWDNTTKGEKEITNGTEITEGTELYFYSIPRDMVFDSYNLNGTEIPKNSWSDRVMFTEITPSCMNADHSKIELSFNTHKSKNATVKYDSTRHYLKITCNGLLNKIEEKDGTNITVYERDKIEVFDIETNKSVSSYKVNGITVSGSAMIVELDTTAQKIYLKTSSSNEDIPAADVFEITETQ